MSVVKAVSVVVLAASCAMAPNWVLAGDLGPATARALTQLYQDTRLDCGDASKPAFQCSGVMIRATAPTAAYQFYSVSPASLANGGVSVSYLRKDAKFASFYAGRASGFIFDNIAFDAGAAYKSLKVLCAFPIDGASLRRQSSGCGDYDLTGSVETFCDKMGVRTAQEWFALYRSDEKYPQGAQCAFDLRKSNPERANAFYTNLQGTALLAGVSTFTNNDSQENEIVVAPWNVDPPYSPPLLAAFYVGKRGLEGARINQIQWYRATGEVLPAIDLSLPATERADATFAYAAQDQAIYPVWSNDRCSRHIESAPWVRYFDAGLKKSIDSLEILPTACGRRTLAAESNNFFNELVTTYYLDPEWSNNADNRVDSIPSMRRQLVCLMAIARNKSTWLLEPARPATTHEKSVAAGCNNAVR